MWWQVISDTSTSEESDPGSDPGRISVTKTPPLQVRSRTAKKLYDYCDPAYLEKSRRARRRKRSEVDIEVGSRLSRFINRPYEGAADKYVGRTAKEKLVKPLYRKRVLNKSPLASSNESSPVGSVERIDKSRANTAVHGNRPRTNDLTQKTSFYNSQRLSRRRSISVSPPRTQSALRPVRRLRHYDTQSYHPSPLTSPGTSPPASIGSSSPALLRYRRSTFKTILSLPTEEGMHKGVKYRRIVRRLLLFKHSLTFTPLTVEKPLAKFWRYRDSQLNAKLFPRHQKSRKPLSTTAHPVPKQRHPPTSNVIACRGLWKTQRNQEPTDQRKQNDQRIRKV